jgi:hypothetical protein
VEKEHCNNLAIALIHYPVYNKRREVVTTALTNLDLHDIARSARTYGLEKFYIVTPSAVQRDLAERIKTHWLDGWGAAYNPDRKEALDTVRVIENLEEAVADFQRGFRNKVECVITGATERLGSIGFSEFREMLGNKEKPYLLLLGTGWGITDECFASADHILKPIVGSGTYNHLSVRSAAAIMLDRVRGAQE